VQRRPTCCASLPRATLAAASRKDAQRFAKDVARFVFRHVVPNVGKVGPAISREITASERWSNAGDGIVSLKDEGATWSIRRGVTSPKRARDEEERAKAERRNSRVLGGRCQLARLAGRGEEE
jgi:hypothetical protein